MSDELKELQNLFTELDPEIASRRAQVLRTIQENAVELFPSDMSLLSAMDDVLQCFAFGGQIRNYYRYGSYSACEAQRKKFWFALWNGSVLNSEKDIDKLASNPREVERRQKIQEFYRQELLDKKANGSLEDIWNERKLLLVNPFQQGPP